MIRVTTWDGDNALALLRASAITEVYRIGNSPVTAIVTADTVYYVKESVEEVEALLIPLPSTSTAGIVPPPFTPTKKEGL